MKKTLEEHAARFDDVAAAYDDDQTPEYNECVALVLEHADAGGADTVLDLGCGTGAIALGLAADAGRVVGRDISDGMLTQAREKATTRGVDNVAFDTGRFREPNYDGDADVVVSNFAMHHLSDAEKRSAIDTIAGLNPHRIVLGDVMLFGGPNPDDPFYSPAVDDPATVGVLADAFTDAGYAVTAVEMVHEQVGVLVAETR
ncbi:MULTISPECIES: class I SAM-dependent methyltransferase [Halobacterium]|uniref:class I SAM-dependent methyltransferase n=1 Tax=Halobacterium TaxID=2239 RepID=UPI0019645F41|nr:MULTISPECIES: class I SAM-dependent methyltransferase [Halobacterium]MCF2207625.1 class I SAM-dependent methyltransferase [Halobacterium salinarum]MDL0125060.1 class I SAM-dependent methyltransferase [Halobacterium salinarum]QRY23681.1 class I SAM-dependent methyltransferase [Halobacterium sp. GSL-19]WJK63099.1 class I SAM-dependent methyltransferase [Halobacterium salinarum]